MSGNPILRALAIAASAALLVTALAVPVLAGDDKVTICHKPDTKAGGTLEVAASAVDAHLAHGDFVGTCGCAIGGDACTYLNLPDWSASYAEHGCVRLDFVGDEVMGWNTLDRPLPENSFTVWVDGVAYPSVIGGYWNQILDGEVSAGSHRLSWGTDDGLRSFAPRRHDAHPVPSLPWRTTQRGATAS